MVCGWCEGGVWEGGLGCWGMVLELRAAGIECVEGGMRLDGAHIKWGRI